jgi:hypothetical protein
LNRFRVAFDSLLLVAAATSLLAGWGIVGSSVLQAGPSATTTTVAGSGSSSSTAISLSSTSSSAPSASSATAESSTESSATVSSASTETVTTGLSTTTVTTTSVSTTTIPGQTVTTTTAAGTVTTTTVVTGTATTTTVTFGGGSTVAVNGIGSTTTSQNSGALAGLGAFGSAASSESLLRGVQASSLLLAPVCWIVLGGMWVWRGRVRARYSEMGFGSDVFELFMKMKGGATRIKVLNTLATPKDRLQLAEELGVDWKTVDRHVQILHKYGFVTEQAAYGTVRLYQVTPMGKMLLNLFDDLERTDGPVSQQQPPASLPSREERPSGS